MANIVLLGGSEIFVSVIKKIRAVDKDSKIILLSTDGCYPYSRGKSYDSIVNSKKSFLEPAEFFKSNDVEFVSGKLVTRINFGRKKIFLEDRLSMDYDYLVISDSNKYFFGDVKGIAKDGVVGFGRADDVRKIIAVIDFVDTVVIQSDDISSLKLAEALRQKGKEVILVSPEAASIGNDDAGGRFHSLLNDNLFRLINKNRISEILGDADVRAVRLDSGKVLACEMVIFYDARIDTKIFGDMVLDAEKLIKVDESFRTSCEGVFAVGAVSSSRQDFINNAGLDNDSFCDNIGCVVADGILAVEKKSV